MATLSIVPLSLTALDELDVPDLAVFVGADERPLKELAGFVDWRLCGGLTRQLRAGLFSGGVEDSVLTVPGRFLPVRRVFVFGAGPIASLRADAAVGLLGPALASIRRAGGTEVATLPPGWGSLPHPHLAAALIDAAAGAGLTRLVVLAPDPREAEIALRDPARARGFSMRSGSERNLPVPGSVLGSKA